MSFLNLDMPAGVDGPSMIFCVGVNYPAREEEYSDGAVGKTRPSLFIRSPRSFVAHGQDIIRPPESEQFDYEGEIALIIGKEGRRIPREQARDHIFGLTLCNEGSIRDWLRHSKFNVTQGKNFDNTGSFGPHVTKIADVPDLNTLELECRVNGELRQKDNTARMMYPLDYLINYVSTFATLTPGDIIVTGTPVGAGARFDPPKWLVPGDVVEVHCPQLGTLSNTVADEVLA